MKVVLRSADSRIQQASKRSDLSHIVKMDTKQVSKPSLCRIHPTFLFVVFMNVTIGIANAQTKADSLSVSKFYSKWFWPLRQGPETYASVYAENGMVLPPNRPPAVGRNVILEFRGGGSSYHSQRAANSKDWR